MNVIHRFLMLLCLCTTPAYATADHYEEGQVIRQGLGVEGDNPSDATLNFAKACESNPFIDAGLAELTGLDDIRFHAMPDHKVLAYGLCVVTILKTIHRS